MSKIQDIAEEILKRKSTQGSISALRLSTCEGILLKYYSRELTIDNFIVTPNGVVFALFDDNARRVGCLLLEDDNTAYAGLNVPEIYDVVVVFKHERGNHFLFKGWIHSDDISQCQIVDNQYKIYSRYLHKLPSVCNFVKLHNCKSTLAIWDYEASGWKCVNCDTIYPSENDRRLIVG